MRGVGTSTVERILCAKEGSGGNNSGLQYLVARSFVCSHV